MHLLKVIIAESLNQNLMNYIQRLKNSYRSYDHFSFSFHRCSIAIVDC